ncbi:MAG: hypothetical protein U0235_30945 [Polyangiaceae bacterium]
MRNIVIAAFVSANLLACTLEPQTDEAAPRNTTEGVATSSLEPHFSARAYETSLRILARFSSFNADNRRLGPGDRLVAVIDGGAEIPMTETVVDSTMNYVAEVPAPNASVHVAIRFIRASGQASALGSEVVVPAPFTIVKAPSTVTPHTPVTINTESVNGPVRLTGWNGCMKPGVDDTARPIAGGVYVESMSGSLETNVSDCPVDFELSADTSGKVDSAFAQKRVGDVAQFLDPVGFVGAQRRTFHATVTK